MKRVISIIFAIALLVFVYMNSATSQPEVTHKKTAKAIDTIVFPDYSLLYTCKPDINRDTCLEVDIHDADLLMKIARAEGGPTLDGQLWAMRVIYNRLYDGSFGDNIQEIVSADKQFDVYTNKSYLSADVNTESHIALAMIEGGWNETEGALYWHADSSADDSWHERNLQYIQTVEGNRYYK